MEIQSSTLTTSEQARADAAFEHYTPGERVEAFDFHLRQWRAAEVERDAPYLRAKTGGAYVRWVPTPAEMSQSIGGWVGSNAIRRAVPGLRG